MRLAAVAAVLLVLLLGAPACGDSDDSASGGAATTGTSADGPAGGSRDERPADEGPMLEAGSGPEAVQEEAAAKSVDHVYEGMVGAIRDGVAKLDRLPFASADDSESLQSVCDLMTREARRQTVDYARRSAGRADVDWTCEVAVGLLLRRTNQAGGLERTKRAKVIGVNVEGDRGVVSIDFGGAKGPIRTVPIEREDGEWKLGARPTTSESE